MPSPRDIDTRYGLCATCVHAKLIRNTRGSVFLMCQRSKTDANYAKYPRTPMFQCPGHERAAAAPGQPSDG